MHHEDGRVSPEAFGDLLHQARRGDREALGKVLSAFRRVLWRRAERYEPAALRPRCSPSDLVQQTLLEAQRDFASFRGETPEELRAWLIRIVGNNLGDLLRHGGSRRLDPSRELPLEDRRAVGPLKDRLVDKRPGPEETVSRREQEEAAGRALQGLSERARQAVRLRYEERLSLEQVGGRLGCSAEAARKLCARALEEIRATVSKARVGGAARAPVRRHRSAAPG
jgi:RNA polymerase sigma-70 factor (ECF subfamily)